jgi:hypothetical protein
MPKTWTMIALMRLDFLSVVDCLGLCGHRIGEPAIAQLGHQNLSIKNKSCSPLRQAALLPSVLA